MEITIATNNGDIGGGEVMLFNIARAARTLGHQVTIVGPAEPAEVVEAAQDEGFNTVVLPAANRKTYMAQLKIWDKRFREGLLWCNGLVPSVATAGHKNRIVHLHQLPSSQQKLLAKIAFKKADKILVPSDYTAAKIKGSETFYNWVDQITLTGKKSNGSGPIRVGFLGRPSTIKGTHTLAEAIHLVNANNPGSIQFVIGGSSKFIDAQSKETVNSALTPIEHITEQLGWVPPQSFFEQVDMLAVPSEVEETFGLVVAEAMSAGVPVIVSDAGALPETAGANYPCVVEQGNAASLAQMIEQVSEEIRTSSPLLEDTLKQAQWRWYEYFSPEAGKAQVQKLLKDLERE